MARILILQEEPCPFYALRVMLGDRHNVTYVEDAESAMSVLSAGSVDLIISRVHLHSGSVFAFLQQVKINPRLQKIPFICFSGSLSARAKEIDPLMKKVGELQGADMYLRLEDFVEGNNFKLDDLRRSIESCIRVTEKPI
jgi:two-component SAPR family response regulator